VQPMKVILLTLIGIMVTGGAVELNANEVSSGSSSIRTPSGAEYIVVAHGSGRKANSGDIMLFTYKAYLSDGLEVESATYPTTYAVGSSNSSWFVGMRETLGQLRPGDQASAIFPPSAYMDKPPRYDIPAGQTVRYILKIEGVKSTELHTLLKPKLDQLGLQGARAYMRHLEAAGFPEICACENGLTYLGGGYLYRTNEPNKAIGVYRWNAELNPRSPFAASALAYALALRGDWKASLRWFERSITLDPKQADSVGIYMADLRSNKHALKADDVITMKINGAYVYTSSDLFKHNRFDIDGLEGAVVTYIDRRETDQQFAKEVASRYLEIAEVVDKYHAPKAYRHLARSRNLLVKTLAQEKLKAFEAPARGAAKGNP